MQDPCLLSPVLVGPIMSPYATALQAIGARIRHACASSGRDPGGVTLLAVSKTFGSGAIGEVYALGQREFGENYVQEAAAKRAELAGLDGLRFVLIGPLQSNKAALAAEVFERVESIDRLKTARRLSAARAPSRGALEVLVQVNISGEASKSGVPPDEALALAREVSALPHLAFRGFMGIAAPGIGEQLQREQFASLRRCRDEARAAGLDAAILSMGMSEDLDAAIAEGATEIRIGSAIFGPRHRRSEPDAGS